MSYHPVRTIETVTIPAHDFGTGSDVTKVIAVPIRPEQAPAAGGIVTEGQQAGRVVGVRIREITEDFAGSTLDAGVQVGDGTDADKYFDSGRVLDESVDSGDSVWLADDGSAEDIEAGRDSVTVTLQSATGTPTGTATVDILFEWF